VAERRLERTGVGRTVAELARIIGGTVEGDVTREITGIRGLKEAGAGDVTFLANPKYAHLAAGTAAGAIVVGPKFKLGNGAGAGRTLIRCGNPDAAFGKIAGLFAPAAPADRPGVHPAAVVDPSAKVGAGVSIGASAVVEAEAEIGEKTVIRAGAYVGRGVKVGRECLIYPHVVLREATIIGDRVILHSGAVIGADGFGYTVSEGRRVKIPQIGRVVIEDDVEIGANTTVDRARFDETVIGRGVKIDNLVQVAHNVRIGENTVIVSLCAIAGSTTLGKNCVLGGQVAIDGHLTVGDNVMIAAKSGVTKDVAANSVISGFPAQDHRDDLRLTAELRKLAGAARRIERLEQWVAEQDEKASGD
jgi:UDP-3-O-[3-hydroxymyristoyl] glucosamine N-acyltransferase